MNVKEKYGISLSNISVLITHLVGIVLMLFITLNYLFYPNLIVSEIIEATIAFILLLAIIWYALIGYKTEGRTFNWLLYGYAAFIAFNTAIHTLNSTEVNIVFIFGSFIVFGLLFFLANKPKNFKYGLIICVVVSIIELIIAFMVVLLSGNLGVLLGGDIIATIANLHVFTRVSMGMTLTALYLARESKLLNK